MASRDDPEARRNSNFSLAVAGVTYVNREHSAQEDYAMFDALPAALRDKLNDMPARANVLKYHRIYHERGLRAALDHADDAVRRYLTGAAIQKANGDYFKRDA